MEKKEFPYGLGWLPDLPDYRDFTIDTKTISDRSKAAGQEKSVKEMLAETGVNEVRKAELKHSLSLREYCSPVENQLNLGSCTANAAMGLLEYYERRAHGNHVDGSRRFLYKTTRNLLGWVGDTGAYIRSTMGAMVLLGIPPERYWPYDVADFDVEPSAFVYALGQSCQAVSYYRLDPAETTPGTLLTRIKQYLGAGLPAMFGFTVYDSIGQAGTNGKIPFPAKTDRVVGGHAVMVVGYDDNMEIKNTMPATDTTTGALMIRNSWGAEWGDGGYGWLPYDYVLCGLAVDWWSLIRNEWIATGQFGY